MAANYNDNDDPDNPVGVHAGGYEGEPLVRVADLQRVNVSCNVKNQSVISFGLLQLQEKKLKNKNLLFNIIIIIFKCYNHYRIINLKV